MANIREFNEAVEIDGHVAAPKYYFVDSTADLVDLPKMPNIAWGSVAFCLENDKKYKLRKSNVWEEWT